MKELELLLIGRQHMYGEGKAEWGEEYCISVSDFNALADLELAVEPGSFLFFCESTAT